MVQNPTLILELDSHPRRPVSPIEVVGDLAHRHDQGAFFKLSADRVDLAAASPIIEARDRHLRDLTPRGHRAIFGLPSQDPQIAGHCPDSFTQKAVARLSRSRSIRNRAFSFRSLANSARSSVVTPALSPASTRD
jgi:hypothetical protein